MSRLNRYEATYSARWRETFGRVDPERTAAEAAFLRRRLPLLEFGRVLDVPCGFGRHMAPLVDAGYDVVGVDNDAVVVSQAVADGLDARLGDMRDLSRLGTFDAVVNMWASFGYFDAGTNAQVLRGFAARVRAGGLVVLDVYDPAFFEARQGERVNQGVRDRKTIVEGRLRAELDYGDGTLDVLEWQLYTPEELAAIGGLELVLACSSFDESSPPCGEAPRMQVVLAGG